MRIVGLRLNGALVVSVDGKVLSPAYSLKVFNHSPTGFECGYGGSGPAQLALALLLAAGATRGEAIRLHQLFKWTHVAHWQAPFEADLDVAAWMRTQRVSYVTDHFGGDDR
jgi:hypothetical protein